MPCLQILSVRAGVTAAEISAGVIFCSVLFSDVAFTEGVVLFDASLAALNLLSFILTGFDPVVLTTAVVAVLFPAVATLLDDKVALFAALLLEAVDFVGAESTEEVFIAWVVVIGAVAAVLCFVLASVVVTACIEGLIDVDWLCFPVLDVSEDAVLVVATGGTLLPAVVPGRIPLLGL